MMELVYIAARNREKASKVMREIIAEAPTSKGKLCFLHLELADLMGIRGAADDFLREDRVDILWNNAGVMTPPVGSKSLQVS
jgi:retinol dehydrogenase-12